MEIPTHIEEAIADAVAHRLEAELGDRGLLLDSGVLASVEALTAAEGARLLRRTVEGLYEVGSQAGPEVVLEFESEHTARRIEAALAFGAVTARVLAPEQPIAGPVELLAGLFNLATGLIDGLVDDGGTAGEALLGLLRRQGLAEAAESPRERGWLRSALPAPLAGDAAAGFAVDILELFFETLHLAYPDERRLRHRRGIGRQLLAGLEAERRSAGAAAGRGTRAELIECSRLTSVSPFQVLEALAGREADPSATGQTAGTLLGEGMWRIDDLVDLCQDARSGSLNAILLGASGEDDELVAVLERLPASPALARAAAEAAESLLAGLRLGGDGRAVVQDEQRSLGRPRVAERALVDQPAEAFLAFVQRYAGITLVRPS